ncbi:hypothetical protein D8S78_24570 [Natrialba swarupiae]|nr:hypothetical protein [Natrialba swarupiae]
MRTTGHRLCLGGSKVCEARLASRSGTETKPICECIEFIFILWVRVVEVRHSWWLLVNWWFVARESDEFDIVVGRYSRAILVDHFRCCLEDLVDRLVRRTDN